MNISELARKLRITTTQLHEALPQMGFDIGRRAIKIDNAVALKIMKQWPAYQQNLQKAQKEVEAEQEKLSPRIKPVVPLPPVITVREFAVLLNIPVTRLIQTLMNNGILAALNEKVDYETASIIAEDLGFIPERQKIEEYDESAIFSLDPVKELIDKEDPSKRTWRPPVIVVMGHVDHGKTTLLDTLRKTAVVASESGGITQHIGAYQVEHSPKDNKGLKKLITFIDTPGHEAFTTMRSRGAKIADIAILVVAADDGIKPQTIEAIKIIQAAGIPLVVAINKIDKSDANIDRVKRELSDHGLIPEDWGGKTVCVPISAKKNTGMEDLLDVLLLVADMEKEKIVANPDGRTIGTIIESHIDKNEGPVATLLVQNGTLHQNDYLVIDNSYAGKVRAMRDHLSKLIRLATPSTPVRIIGFKYAPVVGYPVYGMKELEKGVEKDVKVTSGASVVVSPTTVDSKQNMPSVNIILKTDTLGSLEAIANALLKIDHPEIKVKIVTKELGTISSADVLKAEATKSFIAGFHVASSTTAQELSSEKKVEIKLYKVIYDLIDDVKERIEELLAPHINRVVEGKIKVLKVFRTEHNKHIIGGAVIEGTIVPGKRAAILRGAEKISEGKIARLQSGKQEIPQAVSGQECGITYEGKVVFAEGDIVEVFTIERVKRTLEDSA